MNRCKIDSIRRLRGATMVLMAVMIPVIMGLLALSVDTAVVGVAKSQLQCAADAASLAGAVGLASQQRLQMGTVGASEISAAQANATQLALANKVLGDGSILLPNPSNSNTSTQDLVVGYLSRPYDPTQTLQTDSTKIPYYNSVMVSASRSATHTAQVPSFFSKIWGNTGSDLKVTATAALLGISGFSTSSTSGNANANLLPITLDLVTYTKMMQGEQGNPPTTDQYTFSAGNFTYPLAVGAPNGVSPGADRITESRLYPVGNGYPGNWGTIKVGVSDNSTSTIGAQIRYGITSAQLATYPGGVIQPDPTTGTIQFGGNPGISAGLKDDLTSIIGKPVRIPIFDPAQSGGNGNNLVYTIVAFAPVRILKVNFQGKFKYVIIQPAAPPNDPTQVWGGIVNGPLTKQYRVVLIR
jgi:Flp pilus assembly protein TadG